MTVQLLRAQDSSFCQWSELPLPEQANRWAYQTKEEQKLQKTRRISIHDNFLFHVVPSCQAPWVHFASESPLDPKEAFTHLKLMCSQATAPCAELQIKNISEDGYKAFTSPDFSADRWTLSPLPSHLPERACIVLNPSVKREKDLYISYSAFTYQLDLLHSQGDVMPPRWASGRYIQDVYPYRSFPSGWVAQSAVSVCPH